MACRLYIPDKRRDWINGLSFLKKTQYCGRKVNTRKYLKTCFLKKHNKALLNGAMGGEMINIDFGDNEIFSFIRQKVKTKFGRF
jgi:hypothetical protein